MLDHLVYFEERELVSLGEINIEIEVLDLFREDVQRQHN